MDTDKSLDKIEIAQYPILLVPFFGSPVPVMLRELTQAQIISCGEMSLIETFQDKINKKNKKNDLATIVKYANQNNEIVKKALVAPTYEQIINRLTGSKTLSARKQMDELRELIKQTPRGPRQTALLSEIDALKIWCDLILPEDFMSFIVSYTLGVDKSDIKELSEKSLIEAAILAEKGHDNPADHIDGRFTAFMRDDINKRAWLLLQEQRDKK